MTAPTTPEFVARVAALGAREISEASPEAEVRVVVTLHGRLRDVWLNPSAVRRLDRITLGEVVTATIQAAQRRAAEELADGVREVRAQISTP